jgi:hypothetical protein
MMIILGSLLYLVYLAPTRFFKPILPLVPSIPGNQDSLVYSSTFLSHFFKGMPLLCRGYHSEMGVQMDFLLGSEYTEESITLKNRQAVMTL